VRRKNLIIAAFIIEIERSSSYVRASYSVFISVSGNVFTFFLIRVRIFMECATKKHKAVGPLPLLKTHIISKFDRRDTLFITNFAKSELQ